MTNKLIMEIDTEKKINSIFDRIDEHNSKKAPKQKEEIKIERCIKDSEDNIIAGILGSVDNGYSLYVDILWVKEEYRKYGYGGRILKEVEREAKEQGASMVQLETFDFQAKDFYIKNGYEIYGVLDDCPINHKMYFLKKKLNNNADKICETNTKDKYVIEKCTSEEEDFLHHRIAEYNESQVPFTQEPNFIEMNRVMKNEKGQVAGGIYSMLYGWNCLCTQGIWVSEDYRREGYGSKLLKEMEKEAKEKGCYLIHLETIDLEAKEFFIKNGYEVFAVLDNCPVNQKTYFMKKKL